MKIKVIPVGMLAANCYILEDEQTSLAAVIDPGDEAERILSQLRADGVSVALILLTHGHFDHILAAESIRRAFPDAAVYIHSGDAHGAGGRAVDLTLAIPDLRTYGEGDALTLGSLTIDVLHAPGHSRGSVVLRSGGVLFTGDVLFAGTCGRTDLPGGSYPQMMASLKRLGALDGDYQILPGHGEGSTLEAERQFNPYLRMAVEE